MASTKILSTSFVLLAAVIILTSFVGKSDAYYGYGMSYPYYGYGMGLGGLGGMYSGYGGMGYGGLGYGGMGYGMGLGGMYGGMYSPYSYGLYGGYGKK